MRKAPTNDCKFEFTLKPEAQKKNAGKLLFKKKSYFCHSLEVKCYSLRFKKCGFCPLKTIKKSIFTKVFWIISKSLKKHCTIFFNSLYLYQQFWWGHQTDQKMSPNDTDCRIFSYHICMGTVQNYMPPCVSDPIK